MSSILIGGKHFFFKKNYQWKKFMTPTWFEHAAFWSGVRRATVAPRSQLNHKLTKLRRKQNEGSTEIWTRIAGFKVQSANHYTIEPWHMWEVKLVEVPNCNLCILKDWFETLVQITNYGCKNILMGNFSTKYLCFLPGSNRRPCACEAHVITTTLRKRTKAPPKSKGYTHIRLLSSVG